MSESEKQAWLASLFGGHAPTLLASPSGARDGMPSLFRTASVDAIDLKGAAHGAHDAQHGAAESNGGGHMTRASSLGSISHAPAAGLKLPAPTLADGGAKATSLTLLWSWHPPAGHGLAVLDFSLEWRREGEVSRTMPLDAPPTKATLRALAPNTAYLVRAVAARRPSAVRNGGDDDDEGGESTPASPTLRDALPLPSTEARLLTGALRHARHT